MHLRLGGSGKLKKLIDNYSAAGLLGVGEYVCCIGLSMQERHEVTGLRIRK